MTGISNLNLVLQQGGSGRDMQHIKQQTAEHAQMVAAQQEAIRETELKGRVLEPEATDKLLVKRDNSNEKNDRRQSGREKKKKAEEKKQALTGKLLDTVA